MNSEDSERVPRRWPWLLARLVLAVAGGALLYLSYAPRELWWLAPLAFTCLGLVLHGRRFWGACGYGMVFGLVFFLGQLMWIQNFVGEAMGPLPWAALSAVLAAYFAVASGLITFVARLPAAPVWMAAVFVLQEFGRTWWPFGGFPWGKVAFSQPEGAFLPLASIGGAPLLSFAVVLTGFGLAQLLIRVRTHGVRPRRSWLAPVAAMLVPVIAGLTAWPTVGTAAQAGTRTVAVVQGDAPNIGLKLLYARDVLRRNHLAQSRELLADVRAGNVPRPDLVIWPETAMAYDQRDPALARIAKKFGVPMLVGARIELPGGVPQNLVLQWKPGVGPVDRYAKQQLVPFGEFIPMRAIASWFSPFVEQTVDMKAGTKPGVFHIAGTKLGAAICYEVAYDYVLREATDAGAQLLVVPTNNAWYGRGEMSYQQLAMARMRAVEHGRAVVVAATSGVSAIVRPDGTVTRSTELYTADSLVQQVPLRTETTLADTLGASVEYALMGIAALAIAAGLLRGRGYLGGQPGGPSRARRTRRTEDGAGRTRPGETTGTRDQPSAGGDPDL